MHSPDTSSLLFAGLAGHAPIYEELSDEGIPQLRFPEPFNSAEYFIDRHLAEGRGSKVAVQTLEREVTYAELLDNVNRFGNTLAALGIGRGERVLMVVNDCPEFFFLFWGAIKVGIIPVPLNVLLRASDFAFLIRDSECAGLVYSFEFAGEVEGALRVCSWRPKVVLRMEGGEDTLTAQARDASPELKPVPTRAQDDCFWLYSSGTTGRPKGVILTHADLPVCHHFYTVGVLGAEENDVFFSVARLFFSYGNGFAMAASLWVGGTSPPRRAAPHAADSDRGVSAVRTHHVRRRAHFLCQDASRRGADKERYPPVAPVRLGWRAAAPGTVSPLVGNDWGADPGWYRFDRGGIYLHL